MILTMKQPSFLFSLEKEVNHFYDFRTFSNQVGLYPRFLFEDEDVLILKVKMKGCREIF